jgi:hypothetical protein
MAEGYQCDRCHTTKPGKPELTIAIGEGIERLRVSHEHKYEKPPRLGEEKWNDVKDLCPACRNDLRRWWAEPTGNHNLSLSDPKEANDEV